MRYFEEWFTTVLNDTVTARVYDTVYLRLDQNVDQLLCYYNVLRHR